MKFDHDQELLKKMGLAIHVPDSGCCGMAGAFGFEKSHYDISIACGERVLLPEIHKASKNTLIVADGFRFREQIRQTTDRKALHLARVMKMALKQGPNGPVKDYPEQGYIDSEPSTIAKIVNAALLIGIALIFGAVYKLLKGRRSLNCKIICR